MSNGVTKEELDILTDSRILAIETRKQHMYLEFSHDILCPIAKAHIEKRKIDEQTRVLRKRILAASVLAIVALVLIGVYLRMNHIVVKARESLIIEQIKNDCATAHFRIINGDVLNAIDLLLRPFQDIEDVDSCDIMPDTERELNEAFDSLYSPFACVAVLQHNDDVSTAEYSENSAFIVTASNDGICRIWSAQSGKIIKELDTGKKNMTGASLNKDATKVITSFRDGSVMILNVSEDKVETNLSGHSAAVNYACFSPDGTMALTASDDGTVRLWSVKSGNMIDTLTIHTESVKCALFNTNGDKVITASDDGTSVLCDLIAHRVSTVYSDPDYSVDYAEFNYDGTRIAIVTNNAVHILDAANPNKEPIHLLDEGTITSASFSPDGQTIATSSHDKTIKLWDLKSQDIIHTFSGHSNIVSDVVFSPDGNYLVSTSTDNEARVWNSGAREFYDIIHSDLKIISSATFSPKGTYIAAISAMGDASIWDSKTKDTICTFHNPGIASSIAFNPAEDKLVVTSDCGIIRFYSVESGKMIDSLMISDNVRYDNAIFDEDDGSLFAISKYGRTIQYFPDTHEIKTIITPEMDSLACIETSFRYGARHILAVPYHSTSIYLWDLESTANLKHFDGHTNTVCTVHISDDGKKIISGSSDNTAIVWDVATCDIDYTFKKHSSQVYFADFIHSGQYALSASTDGTVRIWNTLNGEQVAIRRTDASPRYHKMVCPGESSYIIIYGTDIVIHYLYSAKDLINHFKKQLSSI